VLVTGTNLVVQAGSGASQERRHKAISGMCPMRLGSALAFKEQKA
jgi:hypothetical protein